ncbi:hypothetical protein CDAR_370681 [Caerostris darwini]|uniref:Uncharacterized protein n=1 Tax=Caerostris darwini TaxID=1538125 RepID=A0AAV4VGE0_9ARAC|nr:hypothetical protein CDAR_370681 [Caerostris darwini]
MRESSLKRPDKGKSSLTNSFSGQSGQLPDKYRAGHSPEDKGGSKDASSRQSRRAGWGAEPKDRTIPERKQLNSLKTQQQLSKDSEASRININRDLSKRNSRDSSSIFLVFSFLEKFV